MYIDVSLSSCRVMCCLVVSCNVCLCHIDVSLSFCLRFGRSLSVHKIHGFLRPTAPGAMITSHQRVADTTIAAIFVRFRFA